MAPLALSLSTLHDLELNLVLFFTGYSRSASGILKDQSDKSNSGDADMRKNLDETQALGRQIKDCLENGEAEQFGLLMNDHWQRKRRRSTGMSNPTIDELYELGMANGAVGGKLVGAGAGGFLMFYANDAGKLRNAFQLWHFQLRGRQSSHRPSSKHRQRQRHKFQPPSYGQQ